MKLVIDSSVFVAAFREQEPNSREAFRLLDQLDRGAHTAVAPVTVLVEVVAAIRRRTGSAELAREVGNHLLALPTVSLIDITAFRLTRYFEIAATSGLAGMDAIVAGVANEFDLPLVTLDDEMAERARRFVRCLSLGEID